MPFGSDDIPKENLLHDMVEAMELYGEQYDVMYCNQFVLKPDGSVSRRLFHEKKDPKVAYHGMLERHYISHTGSLWKRESCPAYDETLESAVDLELILTAMEKGVRFKHIKKKLLYYRVGHNREGGTQKQVDCCDRILKKRGYQFDSKTRRGIKICN